jgi:hypothetical protein
MRHHRPGLRLVLALVLVGSVGLVAAGLAQANSYQVAVCSDLGTGRPAPSDGWTPATNNAAYEGASGCSSGGVMTAWLIGQHPFADSAAMTFSAPPNTAIDAFWLWRYMYSGVSQPYGSPETSVYYDQTPIDVNSQFYGSPEPEGSTTQQTLVGAQGLDAHTITINALCGGGPSGVCVGGNPTAQVNIYGGDIELNDAVAPAVSGVSGTLTQGGSLAGQQTIIFSASDQGSGVYSANLLIDGIPVIGGIVNSNGGRCVPMRTASDGALVFAYAVPCPTSTSGAGLASFVVSAPCPTKAGPVHNVYGRLRSRLWDRASAGEKLIATIILLGVIVGIVAVVIGIAQLTASGSGTTTNATTTPPTTTKAPPLLPPSLPFTYLKKLPLKAGLR